MTSASVALQQVTTNQNSHPEFDRGEALFDQIISYLTSQNIGHQAVTSSSKICKDCISVTTQEGHPVFISFDFARATAFGQNMEFAISVTQTQDTPCSIQGHDGQRLLMTTNRGISNFDNRFWQFISHFTSQDLDSFTLLERPNKTKKSHLDPRLGGCGC